MSKPYWIVWNETRTEGVIFSDKLDADYASQPHRTQLSVSVLAATFAEEVYDDEDRSAPQKVEL